MIYLAGYAIVKWAPREVTELLETRAPSQRSRALLERRALAIDAYEVLKGIVLDRKVQPGGRMAIDVLAVELGVSQTPIREALARLESDGLVQRSSNGRYHAAADLTEDEFNHLFDVRLQLEPFSAAQAASNISEAELAELTRLDAEMRDAPTGGEYAEYGSFSALNSSFHELIAVATRNPFLVQAIERLRSHHRLAQLYHHRGVIDASHALAEHGRILSAIRRHDRDDAAEQMRQHIERSRGELQPLSRISR
jgi:DNA-binding GntR family transcriptional regulator